MKKRELDRVLAQQAFASLDGKLSEKLDLVLGGGTAMLLAHRYPGSTTDADVFPRKGTLDAVQPAAREVAKELGIAQDWLNSWFTTFVHVLPTGYSERLIRVFSGNKLSVDALGAEDLLILKCFAGRDKDRPHAVRLLKAAKDLEIVDRRLDELMRQGVPGAQKAADFFDDLRERFDV